MLSTMAKKTRKRGRPARRRYVSYLRVSTQRQGVSGLGLEAQRRAVEDYINGNGHEVVAEFMETESGRRDDRPQLEAALRECRLRRAALVVANMSRLTRSVGFLHRLLDSGVEVHFCDLPRASGPTGRFMLNQMASVAELEAGLISQRTRDALAAVKARGVKLGNPQNLTPEGRLRGSRRGIEAQRERAVAFARDVLPVVEEIRAAGATSLRGVARELNRRGVPTSRGRRWSAQAVRRVLLMAAD